MRRRPFEPRNSPARIPHDGLTTEEAAVRLAEFGRNEPTPLKHTTPLVELLSLFLNPLVALLLIASVVSAAVQEWLNAAIIVVMVLLGVMLSFIQTHRSRHAVETLRRSVTPTATVLRDGRWTELPRSEIVPGDVIRIVPGDLVPADARIIHSEHVHVQESALTGESLPVEKEAALEGGAAIPERSKVYLGTSVVSGSAEAIVIATGARTAFGEIAGRLATRAPETEFDRGARQFGMFIMRTVVFLILFVFLANAVVKRDPLESLIFAIALAVGLTPEFLPVITSVTLAHGAVHMARKKVIVKNLATMQNFGSIDILCSDKTGTLTTGELVLDRHVDPFGEPSDNTFRCAYINSALQGGIPNPVDRSLQETQTRDPLDQAILKHDHPEIRGYEKVAEIPFDFERRLLSIVAVKDGQRSLIAKGAPESILARCACYEVNGQRYAIDEVNRARCEKTYRDFGADGLRVVGVAYREIDSRKSYDTSDERDLTLVGFLAFLDPPREEAAAAIRSLHRDGIRVKILTGDNAIVTKYICERVGLHLGRIVHGDEVDRINDAALAHLAEETVAFARVSPMQKNRILMALKVRKHAVGYLGDGINDAPSLHAADVGISVSTAVDVAKDAAEVILLERSLKALHDGIIEGRKAFGNVMKYLLMGTSSNFGNMFSMAAASALLPFLPMLPTQILLNNFLYDLAQVTIPTDNVDPAFIRKPRHWNIRLIRDFMIFIGPISSAYDFLTFYVMLVVFKAGETLFHTGWFVESLATQTLVLFVIRTAGNPFHSRPSRALAATTTLVVLVALLLPFTPLAAALGFVRLPALYFFFLAVMTATYLAFVELVKRRLMRDEIRARRMRANGV
jgi:Mg2+-importing ATPase